MLGFRLCIQSYKSVDAFNPCNNTVGLDVHAFLLREPRALRGLHRETLGLRDTDHRTIWCRIRANITESFADLPVCCVSLVRFLSPWFPS